MHTVIVLAMHGAPPLDFPPDELAEFLGMHHRSEHAPGAEAARVRERAAALEAKLRRWPRTPATDPFHTAAIDLGERLAKVTGLPVEVGFNEFCAPDLAEALDRAAARATDRVLVVTPMMTRGGEHAERDIPAAIEQARARHPGLKIRYAWPPDANGVASFLAAQLGQHAAEGPSPKAVP